MPQCSISKCVSVFVGRYQVDNFKLDTKKNIHTDVETAAKPEKHLANTKKRLS